MLGGERWNVREGGFIAVYLDEANVVGLLTEALTADVEAVLADETGLVGADAAVFVGGVVSDVEKALVYEVSSPAAGTLAVVARARVPDGFVRHLGWFV